MVYVCPILQQVYQIRRLDIQDNVVQYRYAGPNMNLQSLIKDFLEYLEIERNVSQLTIRNYAHYLDRFLVFLSSTPGSPTVKPVKYVKDSEGVLSEAKSRMAGKPVKSVRSEAESREVTTESNDEVGKNEKIASEALIAQEERAYASALKAVTTSQITAESIRQYRLYLSRFADAHDMSLKRVTQNYHLIALRSFLKYALKRDIPVVAPEKIDLPKAESRSIKFLEREQVDRLLNMPQISTPDGMRDKAILETLFSTGLRVSELVKLNRDQMNFDRKEFGVIGKGRRARVVFLSDGAVEWLERYLKNRDDDAPALFIRYAGKKPDVGENVNESMRLTARSVQRLVEKYCKKARLPMKITPHGLRHSFATDLLSGGADLRAIQEMLGHKNVATTQIYTHITNPQLKEIHHKFHHKIQEDNENKLA